MSITLTTVERIGSVGADPAPVAGSGFIYTKLVGGEIQLFYESDLGTVDQITPSTGVPSPWTRAGAATSLNANTDTEVDPNVDAQTSLGTSALRWLTVITASNGLWVYNAAADANRSAAYGNGGFGVRWGVGGATAMDSGFQRIGVAQIAVTSGDGGGSGGLFPFADGTATALLGSNTLRWRAASLSRNVFIFAAAADANPSASYGGGANNQGVQFGAGGINPLDVGLTRFAAGVLSAIDAAGGSGSIVPFVDDSGTLGTAANRWAGVTASGATGVQVLGAANDANPQVAIRIVGGNGEVSMGPGGATAADTRIIRVAANTMAMATQGGQGATVQPGADNSGTLGTAAVRWQSMNAAGAAGRGFYIYNASGDANPTTRVANATVEMGAGGATAVDVAITRSAANVFAISNGGAGSGSVIPNADNSGTLGTAAARWQSVAVGQGGHLVYTAANDANAAAKVSSNATGGLIDMGPGGAGAADARIARTGAGEITIDDTAGGNCNVIPATDHGTNVGASLGLGNRRWAQVNAFEVNTGDIVFTDPGCAVCGRPFEEGDDLVMRVIKVHDEPSGRRTRTVPAHHGCR